MLNRNTNHKSLKTENPGLTKLVFVKLKKPLFSTSQIQNLYSEDPDLAKTFFSVTVHSFRFVSDSRFPFNW